MKFLAQGYTAWTCSLCLLAPLRLFPSERVQRALLSFLSLSHRPDQTWSWLPGVGATEWAVGEEGSLRSPVVGLPWLPVPTSLPNISGDIKLTVTPRCSQLG